MKPAQKDKIVDAVLVGVTIGFLAVAALCFLLFVFAMGRLGASL